MMKTGHLIDEGGIGFLSLRDSQFTFEVQACEEAVIQLYHGEAALVPYTEVRS